MNNRMRYVWRDEVVGTMRDGGVISHKVRVLQELEVTELRVLDRIMPVYEWHDVPTEEEK